MILGNKSVKVVDSSSDFCISDCQSSVSVFNNIFLCVKFVIKGEN